MLPLLLLQETIQTGLTTINREHKSFQLIAISLKQVVKGKTGKEIGYMCSVSTFVGQFVGPWLAPFFRDRILVIPLRSNSKKNRRWKEIDVSATNNGGFTVESDLSNANEGVISVTTKATSCLENQAQPNHQQSQCACFNNKVGMIFEPP